MPRKTQHDEALAFFRKQAKLEGKTLHAWCRENGILSSASERRIQRHEVSVPDVRQVKQ